ncbi:MAG: hypothetical protein CMP22_05190 [Rickettsiales bacterium]|nr:hypothetical protein [Rickettsiales bacterium]
MGKRKVAVFGCKNTTAYLIKELRKFTNVDALITLAPDHSESENVAGYEDLSYLKSEIPNFYQVKKYNLKSKEDQDYIKSLDLDIAFVAGWQRLLPADVLNMLSIGAFGMHGSSQNLPKGRGRSPMNWSLIEGREHFYTNLFRYNPGVDDGAVVGCIKFSILENDTAETLHYKNTTSMVQLIKENIDGLLDGTIELQPQQEEGATYYPKRTPKDSIIDWRNDIHAIDRHIRAVAHPFNGAFSYMNDKKVIIWRASIFRTDEERHSWQSEPVGKVVSIFPSGKFLIRAKGGLLIVHEYEVEDNSSIIEDEMLISDVNDIHEFEKNEHGFHDI